MNATENPFNATPRDLTPRRTSYVLDRNKAEADVMMNKEAVAIRKYVALITTVIDRYSKAATIDEQETLKPYLGQLYFELAEVYVSTGDEVNAAKTFKYANSMGNAEAKAYLDVPKEVQIERELKGHYKNMTKLTQGMAAHRLIIQNDSGRNDNDSKRNVLGSTQKLGANEAEVRVVQQQIDRLTRLQLELEKASTSSTK
ncbi:hypothetical protein HOH87_05380 [bacterium]|jgi:hypothetical protein|nr:hypothetical protein [bacterium]